MGRRRTFCAAGDPVSVAEVGTGMSLPPNEKASRLHERLFGRPNNGLKSWTTFSSAAAAVFGSGGGLLRTLADVGVEDALAQTDVERGGFDEFVGVDVFDGAL